MEDSKRKELNSFLVEYSSFQKGGKPILTGTASSENVLTAWSHNLCSGSRLCLCVPTIRMGGEKIGLSELGFTFVDA